MDYSELKNEMLKYPETMTAEERSRAYFNGEIVDHIPISIGSEEAMAEIFGYSSAQMRDDIDAAADVFKKRFEVFGVKGIRVGLGLTSVAEALGSELMFPERGAERVKTAVLRDSLDGLDSLLKINPYKSRVYLNLLESCKRLKERLPDMPVSTEMGGPITVAANVRSLEQMLRDTIKHPNELKTILNMALEHSLAWMDMFTREFGKVGCGIGDPVSCSNILSNRQYLEYSYPYQVELIKGITDITGKKPKLHICGRTKPLWEDIKKLDVSCVSLDERESLEDAKQVLGESFCISGNVAPIDVMLRGSIDDVIEASRICIEEASDSPKGYILGTGCQIPIGTPRENVEAFCYAARRYGRNARIGEKCNEG